MAFAHVDYGMTMTAATDRPVLIRAYQPPSREQRYATLRLQPAVAPPVIDTLLPRRQRSGSRMTTTPEDLTPAGTALTTAHDFRITHV